jgi:SecD/SecF fusion protein
MKQFVLIMAIWLIFACQPATVYNSGGIIIDANLVQGANRGDINETLKILGERLSLVEIKNPVLSFDPEKNTIRIELPKANDTLYFKRLLMATGKFALVKTFENQEFYPYLKNGDLAYKQILEKDNSGIDPNLDADTMLLFSKLFPMMNFDGTLQNGPMLGKCFVRDTSMLNQLFQSPEISSLFPEGAKLCWSLANADGMVDLIALKRTLDEDVLGNESIGFSGTGKADCCSYKVSFNFKELYHQEWAKLTRENIDRSIAIVIDDAVYAAPRIMSEIAGGKVEISGNYTENEAKLIAALIHPQPLKTKVEHVRFQLIKK